MLNFKKRIEYRKFLSNFQKGQMVNLVFGANCPELLRILNIELERVQKGEPHEYAMFT